MAFDFLKQHQTDWIWIEPGSEQFRAWINYFAAKGWEPFALRAIRRGEIAKMTMPTEWPEWFDKSYSARRIAHHMEDRL